MKVNRLYLYAIQWNRVRQLEKDVGTTTALCSAQNTLRIDDDMNLSIL